MSKENPAPGTCLAFQPNVGAGTGRFAPRWKCLWRAGGAGLAGANAAAGTFVSNALVV
ncbi:hypothetical protein KCP71_12545 [Salmonella enterica subsp. enterica]|nr:hypothetical protein KCP71_12545 [Salmonella enterica subsp. enterica]